MACALAVRVDRFAALLLACCAGMANAETVQVKYIGPVDLAPYQCTDNLRSSFVWRICHRADRRQAVVSLGGTYYGFCNMPREVVRTWLAAPSLGRHYNTNIKGRYGCG
jgi:hypothetical protein